MIRSSRRFVGEEMETCREGNRRAARLSLDAVSVRRVVLTTGAVHRSGNATGGLRQILQVYRACDWYGFRGFPGAISSGRMPSVSGGCGRWLRWDQSCRGGTVRSWLRKKDLPCSIVRRPCQRFIGGVPMKREATKGSAGRCRSAEDHLPDGCVPLDHHDAVALVSSLQPGRGDIVMVACRRCCSFSRSIRIEGAFASRLKAVHRRGTIWVSTMARPMATRCR